MHAVVLWNSSRSFSAKWHYGTSGAMAYIICQILNWNCSDLTGSSASTYSICCCEQSVTACIFHLKDLNSHLNFLIDLHLCNRINPVDTRHPTSVFSKKTGAISGSPTYSPGVDSDGEAQNHNSYILLKVGPFDRWLKLANYSIRICADFPVELNKVIQFHYYLLSTSDILTLFNNG